MDHPLLPSRNDPRIKTPVDHAKFIQSWEFRDRLSRMRVGTMFKYPIERPNLHVQKIIQMRISRVMIHLQGQRKEFKTMTSKHDGSLWIARVY